MKFLTILIDKFKARNPKLYAKAMTVLITVQGICFFVLSAHYGFFEWFPQFQDSIEWLKAVPAHLAMILGGVNTAIGFLTGSSTPGSLGTLLYFRKTYDDGTVYFSENRAHFVPDKLVDTIISGGYGHRIE